MFSVFHKPLIEIAIVESLWHVIIQNRCMSQDLNRYPADTNAHSVGKHLLKNRYRHSLTAVAQRQTIPWETINQGVLQPHWKLYHIQTIINYRSRDQLLKFRTSFHETISSEFFFQKTFKQTQFSQEHWNWRYSNSQPNATKTSAISIELTLLQTIYPRLFVCLFV